MDKVDVLWHKRCPLTLATDQEGKGKGQCKYCKTVKELLRRKIIRRQHNKRSNCLKTSDLSPRKLENLQKLRGYITQACRKTKLSMWIFFSSCMWWIKIKFQGFITHIFKFSKIFFIKKCTTKWRRGSIINENTIFWRGKTVCSVAILVFHLEQKKIFFLNLQLFF